MINLDFMLDNFWMNVEYGIFHILDIKSYDHILFLIVLAVPYLFKDWKRVLLLVTMFTVGHLLSLIAVVYGLVKVEVSLVDFLIPITILVFAFYNIFTAHKKSSPNTVGVLFFSTLFIGLIHGLGFARQFNVFAGNKSRKFLLLLEFELGIEIAQIIIVLVLLVLALIAQTVFRFSKRDWVMVVSSIVIGLVIPMLLQNQVFR